jgi:hypothetical protein
LTLLADFTVMTFLFQHLLIALTAYILKAQLLLKREVLLLQFLSGTAQSVLSVTFAQWFALTL